MSKTKYTVKYTTDFKKDYKRAIKRGLAVIYRIENDVLVFANPHRDTQRLVRQMTDCRRME